MRSIAVSEISGGIFQADPTGWDQLIQEWSAYLSSPFFDRVLLSITNLGSPWAFISLTILFSGLLVISKQWREAFFMNGCLLTSWWLMSFLKELFARPRPAGEHLAYAAGYSFPSGHAMLSMAFYGFLAYLALQKLPGKRGKIMASVLVILILFIGISRVFLNVHYFSDVAAGFLFGGVVLMFFIKLLQKTYS